ncbi:MAG TPA: hypothetical protein VMT56_03535, partial [Candidatus Bathyarchaeia archaeon]|nr:hypothetical protein [Candidatus Bathyarchaeia archaeon]
MNNDAEFDGLLHEALSEYREAEPLAGIESRILARIQDRDARRKTPGWRWALAGACAAALVVAIWFGALRRAPQSAAPNINVATTKPVEKTPAEKPQATA